jgi:hypothetical protein
LNRKRLWVKPGGVVTDDGVFVRGGISYATTDIFEMKCSHGNTNLLAVNPKVSTMTTETGGGYAK